MSERLALNLVAAAGLLGLIGRRGGPATPKRDLRAQDPTAGSHRPTELGRALLAGGVTHPVRAHEEPELAKVLPFVLPAQRSA